MLFRPRAAEQLQIDNTKIQYSFFFNPIIGKNLETVKFRHNFNNLASVDVNLKESDIIPF